MNKVSFIITGLLFLSSTSFSYGDTLSIAEPSYSTPNSVEGILRPTRGMTMKSVEQKFGSAETKSDSVGEPPITEWTYPTFSVFFESNIVIHSVISR